MYLGRVAGWAPRAGRVCVLSRRCLDAGPVPPACTWAPDTGGSLTQLSPAPLSSPPPAPGHLWSLSVHGPHSVTLQGPSSPTCSFRPLAHEGACGLRRRHGSWVGSSCVLLEPDGVTPGLPAGEPKVQLEAAWPGEQGGMLPLHACLCGFSDTGSGWWSAGFPGAPGGQSSLLCFVNPTPRVSVQGVSSLL